MARVCSSNAMRCAAGRSPRPRSTFSDIDNSPALVKFAITRSGFRISMSWSPAMSPAVTGPGPFLCRRTSATSRVCMRMATALRFSRMSTTSSCTPSIAVYSWSTPSISISVIAAPGKNDSSTRRKALPRVCPKPRSNGSITIRAWRVDTGCTLTTRGFKNSVMDPCMEYLAKDFGHCAARAAMPPAGRREDALLGIQLDDQALVDVGQDLLPFGNSLQKTGELLVVHFDPVREAHLGRHREGRRYASLLLRFLTEVDHIAGLALIGGDVHQLVVYRHTLVTHQLPRLGARDGKAHPVDHVIETRFQKLQQRLAGRAGTARGLLVVVAELPLEHSIHAAQLLLLAQLQPVLGQTLLALALHTAGRHLELALRLERLRPALQEQVGPLASGELAFRTGVLCHGEP